MEQVPLNKSQKFTGPAEPIESVLTHTLISNNFRLKSQIQYYLRTKHMNTLIPKQFTVRGEDFKQNCKTIQQDLCKIKVYAPRVQNVF